MQSIKIITPYSDTEITNYYQIRFDELRKPWNQLPGSEKDTMEDECVHRMAVFKDEYIGVARLQYNQDFQAQIRYMAVGKNIRLNGVGTKILKDLIYKAKLSNKKKVILHSRENAIDFYKKNGFILIEKSHKIFNSIQLFLMEKAI